MRSDTQKRINKYMSRLPHIREKVGATGLALLIAGIVAVSATFAWVTLSRAPEVSGLATSMSANGSLEIALSKEDGSQPDEFDVDESVGVNDDVYVTNLTWGNLVNLSDERYGIENLALRPAQLNSSALLTNPLWGAEYAKDGRITQLNTNFAYAVYRDGGFITNSDVYGVRAIASCKVAVSDASSAALNEKRQDIINAHTTVNTTYSKVAGEFSALGTLISTYAQDNLNGSTTNLAPELKNMISCYDVVQDAMEKQMDAYVALANFQIYVHAQNIGAEYVPITWAQILEKKADYNVNNAGDKSSNGVVSLIGLTAFINDYNKLVADIGYLNQYNTDYKNNGTSYYWSSGGVSGHQINNIVADLIDYSSMTVDLKGDGKEVKVTELSSDNAMDLLGANHQSRNVFTYNGILIRFEQLAVDESYRLNGRAECTISVTYVLTIVVNGKAYTKASGPATFSVGYNKVFGETSLVPKDTVADDTFGMAVDFWVRTNAEETCLTLEGAVAMDEEGNVVRYDGVNRVWGSSPEAENLPLGSTTQGGGSCYIYYADTPEDMWRSLDLLDAMKVAFVDSAGNLLATAEMDVAQYFAANGRITVPLVLSTDTQTTYTFTNSLNQEMVGKAITTLFTDIPQRIEAIIYLDGTNLGNDNVLSSAEIQGQLNIQFGSSTKLKTIGNADLMDDVRMVSASLSKEELDYNSQDAEDRTVGVEVHVDGAEPSSVSAFFVRAINSQQGTREEKFVFTKQQDGYWLAEYEFAAPGEYYLRYVRLDGVDYPLMEPQKVIVKGNDIKSVTWGESSDSVKIRTSADSYSETVSVEFATTDRSKMPSAVSVQFERPDGNRLSIPLSYTPSGKWTGKGTFTVSDRYTLSYLVCDIGNKKGIQEDLKEKGFSKTLDLALGLRVEVSDGSGSLMEQYVAGNTYTKNVRVHIRDNAGNEMTELSNAVLYYSNGGSITNTINTNLTWNEANHWYFGQLPITRAGRYVFSFVSVDGDILTRCTESPVYRIVSPDPPAYNKSSLATFNDDNVQFAPLTNDAVIDGLKIDFAESATVDAVVYNDAIGEYYPLRMDNDEIYLAGDSWVIRLPSYTTDLDENGSALPNAVFTQEGTWELVLLSVYDCYDGEANLREIGNPIIWVDNGSVGDAYLELTGIEPDERYSFSKLSTTVSCTYHVEMLPGDTALGSASDPFMSHYAVSDIGMKVRLTDDADRVIPSNKIGDIVMTVNYAPDSTNDSYGYKVQQGAARSYTVSLNARDPDTGYRVVSGVNGNSDGDWQYVGRYNVQSLSVALGSNILQYAAGVNGVPEQYTITTAGPSADNIALLDENITQRYTTLGKVLNTVTGTFLQAQDPGVSAKISLVTADNSDTQYVILDGVTMQLIMTYQDGKTAPNGGYSWAGTSQYETVTIDMTNNSGTYRTSAAPLLAGTYAVQLKSSVNGANTIKDLSNVSVYSLKPTLKVTGVSPAMGETIKVSTINDTSIMYEVLDDGIEVEERFGVIEVSNYYSELDGSVANVFISIDEPYGTKLEDGKTHYTVKHKLPSVSFELSQCGTAFNSCRVVIPNQALPAQPSTVEFGSASQEDGIARASATIGYIETKSDLASEAAGCSSNKYLSYDVKYDVGKQTISSVSLYDKAEFEYEVILSNTVTIRESSDVPPSVQFVNLTGYTQFNEVTSPTSGEFLYTLPDAESFGVLTAEEVESSDDAEWVETNRSTTGYYYYADLYTGTQGNKQYNTTKVTNDKKGISCYEGSKKDGCDTIIYYQCGFIYHVYQRVQKIEESTSVSKTYSVTRGLVGWEIDGVQYDPGSQITVTKNCTAIPVIGIKDKTFIAESVQTLSKTYEIDEFYENKTVFDTVETNKDSTTAKARVTNLVPKNGNTPAKPYNSNDPFSHLDSATAKDLIIYDWTEKK